MIDPASLDLDTRPSLLDFASPDDGIDWDEEFDGDVPDDLLRDEATIATFQFESVPASAMFLKVRQDGNTLRLRVSTDGEGYPGQEESALELPVDTIDEPFTPRGLIRFLDAIDVETGFGSSAPGMVQSSLSPSKDEQSRHERQQNTDFFHVSTVLDAVNEWYEAVIAHYVETGKLVYLNERGADPPYTTLVNAWDFDFDFRPGEYGDGKSTIVTISPLIKREWSIEVVAGKPGDGYTYSVVTKGLPEKDSEAIARVMLPIPQSDQPLTMGELIATLDSMPAFHGGLIFRDLTRRDADTAHVAVRSEYYPALGDYYGQEWRHRLDSPAYRLERNRIRTLRSGGYDLTWRPETYWGGDSIPVDPETSAVIGDPHPDPYEGEVEIARLDHFEVQGTLVALCARAESDHISYRYRVTIPDDRMAFLRTLAPGIESSADPLTLQELVALIDTTRVGDDGAIGLQRALLECDAPSSWQLRRRNSTMIEFWSEAYPDLGELLHARAYEWVMKGDFLSADQIETIVSAGSIDTPTTVSGT